MIKEISEVFRARAAYKDADAIVAKVWLAKSKRPNMSRKLLTVPKHCTIKPGDYVKLVKIC